jgi:hypothetical protein
MIGVGVRETMRKSPTMLPGAHHMVYQSQSVPRKAHRRAAFPREQSNAPSSASISPGDRFWGKPCSFIISGRRDRPRGDATDRHLWATGSEPSPRPMYDRNSHVTCGCNSDVLIANNVHLVEQQTEGLGGVATVGECSGRPHLFRDAVMGCARGPRSSPVLVGRAMLKVETQHQNKNDT